MILIVIILIMIIILLFLSRKKETYKTCKNSKKINNIEYINLKKNDNCIINELNKNENEDKIHLYNVTKKCRNGTFTQLGFNPKEIIDLDKDVLTKKTLFRPKDTDLLVNVVDNEKMINLIIKYLNNMANQCLISSPTVQNRLKERMTTLERKYNLINQWYQKNKPSTVVKSGARAGQNIGNQDAMAKQAGVSGLQNNMPDANMNKVDPDKI